MYGSYSSERSYHSLRSLEVIANSLFGCIFSYKAYGFNFPICESWINVIIKLKTTNIMKKHNFLIGLTLLIVSVILSNIFNENTITNRAIESFFYLPIAYNFVKAFYSKGNWLNLLLVSALICSIIIFTPKWGAWACLMINIVCCLFSYIILLLAIKIANNFNQK